MRVSMGRQGGPGQSIEPKPTANRGAPTRLSPILSLFVSQQIPTFQTTWRTLWINPNALHLMTFAPKKSFFFQVYDMHECKNSGEHYRRKPSFGTNNVPQNAISLESTKAASNTIWRGLCKWASKLPTDKNNIKCYVNTQQRHGHTKKPSAPIYTSNEKTFFFDCRNFLIIIYTTAIF